MQDSYTDEANTRLSRSAGQSRSGTLPSSSRMLATYLTDVERLLDERQWDLALRDAYDLPTLAVALSDPNMRSSRERCDAWCAQWIRPPGAKTESGADQEHICRILTERVQAAGSRTDGEAVPSLALRRLRLRRYARIALRGFVSGRVTSEDPSAEDAVKICTAVVEGVRRWYAHSACHDPVAQENLAKLAVLR